MIPGTLELSEDHAFACFREGRADALEVGRGVCLPPSLSSSSVPVELEDVLCELTRGRLYELTEIGLLDAGVLRL